MSYEGRLRELYLWTLEERRNRTDIIEMFKMYKGLGFLSYHTVPCSC